MGPVGDGSWSSATEPAASSEALGEDRSGSFETTRGDEGASCDHVGVGDAASDGVSKITTARTGAGARLASAVPGGSTNGSRGARARWASSGKGTSRPPTVSSGTGMHTSSASSSAWCREMSTVSVTRALSRHS
jgi:hypothetical protein